MSISWVQIVQLFFSLSLLIILHELGHFLAARMFKTRVDKFYLFFDFMFPFPNLLNFSLFKKKIGDTEYGLGWFPMGGYVKIAGMVDESMDKEAMKQPPQPWEYRSKPAWQRLIMIMGGVLVNFILGLFLYILALAIWGDQYLPNKNVKYGIACDSIVKTSGLQNGDKIISLDGQPVENFEKIPADMILNMSNTVQVEREGKMVNIAIPEDFYKNVLKSNPKLFIMPRFPFVVDEITKESTKKSGLQKGDRLIGVNDVSTIYFDQFKSEIGKNKNKEIAVNVLRNNKDTLVIKTIVPSDGLLGIVPVGADKFLEFDRRDYSVWEAIPAGVNKTFTTLGYYIKQFKLIFSPKVKGYEHLGGFASMAKTFPSYFSWEGFVLITAFISLVLAFMNLLPIPMLDGGYVVFILWEMITGKQPGEKFMEYVNYIGMIFLLGLMIYVNLNDALR